MSVEPGFWKAPELWPGGECFILGGGPSLQGVDIDLLKGRRTIAINNAFKLAPWIDVLFFGDCSWFSRYHKELLNFAGLKVTTCPKHKGRPGVKVIKKKNAPFGISDNPYVLRWNLSSGACAIGLAVHFGVKRIVLLGFDMQRVNERCNWHDDYGNNPKKDPYVRFLKPFPEIAKDLGNLRIECVNATPGSALKEFPIVKPEDVL